MEERLQKILAQAGIASRRAAEQLIREGRIRIDGQVVRAMGVKADPDKNRITCDGKAIRAEHHLTVLLHKPAGYVTTLSDPQGRPIVSDLLAGLDLRLFPVGRLDLDTEGALLMTNDGALSHAILHPRFGVNKTYEALINGIPGQDKLRLLARGIELDGYTTSPAKVRLLRHSQEQSLVEIIIHEGKKRQVRKMLQTVGHRVLHLKRTAYGSLRLGTLPSGQYRILGQEDLKKIFPRQNPFTIKKIVD